MGNNSRPAKRKGFKPKVAKRLAHRDGVAEVKGCSGMTKSSAALSRVNDPGSPPYAADLVPDLPQIRKV
jgi:hypothetical protein